MPTDKDIRAAFERIVEAEHAMHRAAIDVMMLNPRAALAASARGMLADVGNVTAYAHLSPTLSKACDDAKREALAAVALAEEEPEVLS